LSDSSKKKVIAVAIATVLMSEAYALVNAMSEDRPRKKKTWIEKQQARRGWHEP